MKGARQGCPLTLAIGSSFVFGRGLYNCSMLSKKDLEHLAELARIELKRQEEEKLLKDLEKILEHFEELRRVNTEDVAPLAGGTFEKNVLREDDSDETKLPAGKSVAQFPEKESGFLKIPPVFE